MTFIEMVESIAKDTGLTKKSVHEVLHSFLSKTTTHVLSGDEVKLPAFGRFTKKVIKPKVMFGKQTQERTTIKFRSYV